MDSQHIRSLSLCSQVRGRHHPLRRCPVKGNGWSSVLPGKSREHRNPPGNAFSDVLANRLFKLYDAKAASKSPHVKVHHLP